MLKKNLCVNLLTDEDERKAYLKVLGMMVTRKMTEHYESKLKGVSIT